MLVASKSVNSGKDIDDTNLPDDTFQRLYDIDKFDRLLRNEGLTYPILAKMCHLVAEWHQGSLSGDPSRAASYEDRNRRVASKIPRKELDLGVICTGHKSCKLAKTMRFMRRLKLVMPFWALKGPAWKEYGSSGDACTA